MKTVVAIGGGHLSKGETRKIDRFIVSLAQKEHPTVLFLPTASHDSEAYIESFVNAYTELGCAVSVLRLTQKVNINLVRSKIFSADIIYVGGGNTAFMMSLWKRLKVDEMLKTAYERGIILSGLSAGAICWCKNGYSDSESLKMTFVKGLGIIPISICPHYDEPYGDNFDADVGNARAVALENLTALVYTDGKESFLRCDSSKTAYIIDGERAEVSEWISL